MASYFSRYVPLK